MNNSKIKRQSLFEKYKVIYRFYGGGLLGLKHVLNTFREIDLFDLLRPGIDTASIKTEGYFNNEYMFYSPVYSTVFDEMVYSAFNNYTSAIRYSNLGRKTVFLDLGCGSCKTVIRALEKEWFDLCVGVDIDEQLVALGKANIESRLKQSIRGQKHAVAYVGNAEIPEYVSTLLAQIDLLGIDSKNMTLFVFNKNSYGPNVLRKSLGILDQFFTSIVYLYQNPVHGRCLIEAGYEQFLADDAKSRQFKNYRYKLYIKHRW